MESQGSHCRERTDDSPRSFEEPEAKKKSGCVVSPLGLIVFLTICTGLAIELVPNMIRARAGGHLTACKSNLKNRGTALERYSTDWRGKYPETMGQLTPNYLKTIPECPAAGAVTYTLETGPTTAYNTQGFADYYFLQCKGKSHSRVSVPRNYPQYDGIQGLIER